MRQLRFVVAYYGVAREREIVAPGGISARTSSSFAREWKMTKIVRRFITTSVLLLSASVCAASGWNDYILDIGDNYVVQRSNSLDVCIGKSDRNVILFPRDYDSVGPVVGYITTSTHIMTKNHGRTSRDLFDGDMYQEVDPSREFFFIIVKGTDEVVGPLPESDFTSRPEVVALGSLDWRVPENPYFWRPLLGTSLFIAISIPILAIKYFWISIPFTVGVVLLVRYIRRRRALPSSAD